MQPDNEKIISIFADTNELLRERLTALLGAGAKTRVVGQFVEAMRMVEECINSIGEDQPVRILGAVRPFGVGIGMPYPRNCEAVPQEPLSVHAGQIVIQMLEDSNLDAEKKQAAMDAIAELVASENQG